jgi:NhaP-type Na+/H+ or K+/H+ antiporter
MTWTLTNFFIEIVGGIAGGLGMPAAVEEHSFGALGHSATGAIGGAISGYFFQTAVATVVNSAGSVQQDPDAVTEAFLQMLGGLAAGAIVTMIVGFAKHSMDRHRAAKQ